MTDVDDDSDNSDRTANAPAEAASLGERQREIAEAVLRIVARDGLDAVTIRTVAAEAGRSLGWVQREFPAKDLLLRLTLIHAIDQMDRRIAAQAAELGTEASIRSILDTIGTEVLPSRPEKVAEERVWLAFMARAALTPGLAEPLRRRYAKSHTAIADMLAIAHALGQTAPGIDPHHEALTLTALADGLSAQILVGILTHEQAVRILHSHLDRVVRYPAGDEPSAPEQTSQPDQSSR